MTKLISKYLIAAAIVLGLSGCESLMALYLFPLTVDNAQQSENIPG